MTGRMNFKRHVLETNAEYCTADYGTRQPDYPSHHGMDFVNDLGGVCYAVAVADGEVVYVQNGVEGFDSVNYTAGNYVKILHENGTITRYLHLRNGSICVKIGQKVKAGDKLGVEGNTGYSYGTHLHFDVQAGNEYVDPLPYLTGEKDFGNEKPSSDKSEIKIGDRVKIKQGATFSDGTKPFDYVYEQIFEVYNISRDGKEALIGLSGDYTGWVYLADLEKVSNSTFFILIALGREACGIKIKNVKFEKGNKPTDWTPAPEDDERRIASLEARVAALEAAAISGGE